MKVKHHIRGTNTDQIKIIMQDQWDRHKKYEFAVDELLAMWNERGTTKHTRQQVTNAITSLRVNGVITITHSEKGRTARSTYSLTKVLEKMTEPVKEEPPAGKPVIIEQHKYDSEPATVEALANRFTAFATAYNEFIKSYDQSTETLNKNNSEFKFALTTLGEFIKSNFESVQENLAGLSDGTNQLVLAGFEAIQKRFDELENLDRRSEELSVDMIKVYRQGYIDGRDDYRKELSNSVKTRTELMT